MANSRVAVVFGSDSDWPVMQKCVQQLEQFDISVHVEVMSAHRTPARVMEYADTAAKEGIEVIIAGAGMAAALPGVVAAHTTLPVIGVPLVSGSLGGVDALLSIAQMPPGVPVACVGVDSAGAKNAALLAIQFLAVKDEKLAKAYAHFRANQADGVRKKNEKLQHQLGT